MVSALDQPDDTEQDVPAYPRPNAMVQADTLVGLVRILDFINVDKDALAKIDRIIAAARSHGISFQDAAHLESISLTAPIVAFPLHLFLHDWSDGGAAASVDALDNLNLGHFDLDEHNPADRVVAGMIRVMAEMAGIRDSTLEWDARRMAAELKAIGDTLVSLSAWDPATRCFDVCCNLIGRVGEDAFARCAEKAIAYVHRVSDAQLVSSVTLKSACARVAQAEGNAHFALRAYDAVYDAMLVLADHRVHRLQAEPFFQQCLGQESYQALIPLFVLSDPDLDRTQLSEALRDIRVVPQLSTEPVGPWVKELMTLRPAMVRAENGRLALEPKPADPTTAQADWTTWRFWHPAYYRAIPDSSSILRDPEHGNLLMVLAHEITHIYSMNGFIGLTIQAARITLLDLTVRLSASLGQQEPLRRLPQLHSHDPISLARCEQIVQLMRKLQIIQEVWAPWFEGIAIFAELADPRADELGYAPAMEVLQNLIDHVPERTAETTREQFASLLRQFMRENEERYAKAVDTHGMHRLLEYVVTYRESYLAGYLTVRSVVTRWRATLAEPLSAAIAGKVLLHLTRLGTSEALPDLATPLEQFLDEALRKHLDWVQELITISAQDLREAARPYSSEEDYHSLRWVRGRLLKASKEESNEWQQSALDLAFKQARQAWGALRGSSESAGPPEDENSAVMQMTSEALLNERYREDFAKQALRRLIAQVSVLPFAKVEARFWLNCADTSIFCLLRTSETAGADGTPGYNGLLFKLEQDEFDALLRAYQVSGASRMSVYRIADVTSSGATLARGYGRQCIALQYGDWLHVQMRGLVAGSTPQSELIDDVRIRCVGDELTRFDRDILGNGHQFAGDVRDWIDRAEHWAVDEHRVSIEPWAEQVRRQCEDVLTEADTGLRRQIRSALLTRVVGFTSDTTDELLSKGLRAFARPIPGALSAITDLLYRSAAHPLADTQAPAHIVEGLFYSTPLGLDVRPAIDPATH